jgi:hypothetical protein
VSLFKFDIDRTGTRTLKRKAHAVPQGLTAIRTLRAFLFLSELLSWLFFVTLILSSLLSGHFPGLFYVKRKIALELKHAGVYATGADWTAFSRQS